MPAISGDRAIVQFRSLATWLAGVLLLIGFHAGAHAQEAVATPPPKVEVALIAPVSAVRAGTSFVVGLRQKIVPHWHTYWKNPGDSGEPTRIEWQLPDGWTASEIRWPVPHALPVGPLMNYGYSDEVVLPVEITPPPELSGTTVTLKAHATWLVCEKICIPEEKSVSLTLKIAADGAGPLPPSEEAGAFERAIGKLPKPVPAAWTSQVVVGKETVRLDVKASGLRKAQISGVTFFAGEWGVIAHAAKQQVLWRDDGVSLVMKRGELAGQVLGELSGVLVLRATDKSGNAARVGYEIVAKAAGGAQPVVAVPAPPASSPPSPQGDQGGAVSLLGAVLFAFLGGLILNLMPCVLPILSVKALSLAAHGGRAPAFAFLAGVLISFAVLAALLVGLRAAGETVGWGFQFQSPLFVLALAAFFFAMALSLSGVFDIGGGIIGTGEALTHQSGARGAFFTGVLATIAATPCTAPFMGVAMGYALTRPAWEMVVVLQALGIGFALPLMALALSNAMRKLLPKPGAWMDTLKQALAFPLYATVGWLVWVLSLQAGSSGVLAAAVALVATGFAAWMVGQAGWPRVVRYGGGGAVAAIALAVLLPMLEGAQPVQAARPPGGVNPAGAVKTRAIAYEPFSEARVRALRAQGRNVFVNLTAAWCISCKVNEQVALSGRGFAQALKTYDVAYLKGDWTRRDDAITRVLKAHGRAGVPLYLLYPADLSAKPIVLPQLLTEAIVTNHFAAVGRKKAAAR